jgi:hypothetical protein
MSRRAVTLAVIGIAALRLVDAFHLEFDSDEPQHLHVVWAWTRGLLPYRDVFDNHAPLFHLACAPLLGALGERASILVPMRLALFPAFALTLLAIAWLGRRLFSARVAAWGTLMAALWPEHFLTSLEFRPDGLWSALWLMALTVLVAGRLTARRAAVAGLLMGLALAVSLKTALLVATLAAAAALTAHAWRGLLAPGVARRLARPALALTAGLVAVPGAVLLWFAARGALPPLVDCVVRHNLLPGAAPGPRALILLIAVVLLGWLAATQARRGGDPGRGARRSLVALSAALYLAALEGLWPILTPQDFLPFEPLAALFAAAFVLGPDRAGAPAPRRARPAFAGVIVAAELIVLIARQPPWRDRTGPETRLIADVLSLTGPADTVMDLKGEMVYRPRAFYWVLETITRERMRRGLIPDRIPERLIETHTAVVANDSHFLPPRARGFMDTSYVSVGSLRVAGRVLEPAASAPRRFTVIVPGRYVVRSARGAAAGRLDGQPCGAPVSLAAGPHRYDPAPGEGPVAVWWARAAESGYAPRPMESPRP